MLKRSLIALVAMSCAAGLDAAPATKKELQERAYAVCKEIRQIDGRMREDRKETRRKALRNFVRSSVSKVSTASNYMDGEFSTKIDAKSITVENPQTEKLCARIEEIASYVRDEKKSLRKFDRALTVIENKYESFAGRNLKDS